MANYIEKYQDSIGALVKKHKDRSTPEKLEQMAYVNLNKTDLYQQNDDERKRRIDAEKSKLANEYRADILIDIEDEQRKLVKDHQAQVNRLSRLKVRAATGSQLVSEYAKAHGLTDAEAKAELDDYASIKVNRFEDSLSDRYAAIRNISKVKDQDLSAAHTYLEQETEKLGIKDLATNIKEADFYIKQHPIAALDYFSGSGFALMQQMKGKFKE